MEPTLTPHATDSYSDAESALRPLLDGYAQQECSSDELTSGLVAICTQHPAATWEALSLLDQYHRRRVLSTELFNEAKRQLNAIAFGDAGAHITPAGRTYARGAHTKIPRTAKYARPSVHGRTEKSSRTASLHTAQQTSSHTSQHTAALRTSSLKTSSLKTSNLKTSSLKTSALKDGSPRTESMKPRRTGGDSPMSTSTLDYSQLALPTPEIADSFLDQEFDLDAERQLEEQRLDALDAETPSETVWTDESALDARRRAVDPNRTNWVEQEPKPAQAWQPEAPADPPPDVPLQTPYQDTEYEQTEPDQADEDLTASRTPATRDKTYWPAPTDLQTSARAVPDASMQTSARGNMATSARAAPPPAQPSNLTLPRDMRSPTVVPQDVNEDVAEVVPDEAYWDLESIDVAALEPVQAQQVQLAKSHIQRAGTVLNGRYMLVEPIVSGSISAVFKALDYQRSALPQAERYVAIKCPQEALQHNPRTATAFQYEYSKAQSISHPNVAKVYDYYADQEQCFIVMELLQGESLDLILERIAPRRLPISRALTIIREVGNALAHAHERGVLHGNLYPGNITVLRNGELRVSDFGQAAAWQPGVVQEMQPSDDIYNLARIAHELLCGCGPEYKDINMRAKDRPHYAKHLSNQQWQALQKGLSDSRLQRTAKVRTWLAELDLSGADIRLPELSVLESESANSARSKRTALIAVGAAVAAIALLVGGWGLSSLFDSEKRAPVRVESVTTDANRPSDAVDPATVSSEADRLAGTQTQSDMPTSPSASAANAAWTDASSSLPAGPAAALPTVSFAINRYEIPEQTSTARLVIQRSGPADRELVLRWFAIPDSAIPDRDYVVNDRATVRMPAGQPSAEIYIPIVRSERRDRALSFDVRIGATSEALPGRMVSTKVVLLPAMSSTPQK
ncbi:MAG TPA: serine/threonine-protein kinase [Steroidobacteraceae bacterium]|nr:serine/threonine-protein kinase [Steroidobacteraceae bacterium]